MNTAISLLQHTQKISFHIGVRKVTQGLGGGAGFGIFNVHARPYTNVFPTKAE